MTRILQTGQATLARWSTAGQGGRMAQVAAAALVLSVAAGGASAQLISPKFDTGTSGNWQSSYGTCGYVLTGAKVPPNVEVPVINGLGTGYCSGATCTTTGGPITASAGNYLGGASSDLLDCKGQRSDSGFIGAVKYTVRLCSQNVPGYTIPNGYPGQGGVINRAQAYVSECNTQNSTALQFPTDTLGVNSCSNRAAGCVTLTNGGRSFLLGS